MNGYPDSELAKSIKLTVDSKLLDSFDYLLKIACDGLNIELKPFSDIINKVRNQKLSSKAYLYHTKLKNSLKEQNIDEVKTLLRHLINANLKSSRIIIDSLKSTHNTDYENELLLDIFKFGYVTTYNKKPDLKALEKENSKIHIDVARNSLELLKTIDFESYHEIQNCVSEILVYESNFMNSGSSFNTLGLITMNKLIDNQNWTTYLEIIVHEAAHLHLYNLMTIDSLFKNQTEKYYSPLRQEKRPMIGIFHGMFVLSRIIRVFNQLEEYYSNKTERPEIVYSYNNSKNNSPHIEKFYSLYSTIVENAELTEIGEKILSDCKKMTEKLYTTK